MPRSHPVPCSLQSLLIALVPIWTKKHDTNTVWFPLTAFVTTAGWTKVRTTIEVRSVSGNFLIQFGYQLSNDRLAYDSPVAVGDTFDTTTQNDGTYPSTTFADIGSAIQPKVWVRFGLLVKNKAGESTLETGMAGGKLDFA